MAVNSPRSLKSDKRYKDAPRYPVIYQYEADFKDGWKGIMKVGLTEFKLELAKTVTGKRSLK